VLCYDGVVLGGQDDPEAFQWLEAWNSKKEAGGPTRTLYIIRHCNAETIAAVAAVVTQSTE